MLSYTAAVLVLAAGAFAQTGVPCQPNPVCNLTDLARCNSGFDTDLGLPVDLDIYKFDELEDKLENILGNGDGGLEQVCQALRSFKTCFNDVRDYDRCMFNPLGLVGDRQCQPTGISEKQARGYTRVFTSLDFACGFGYSHFWNAEDKFAGCVSGVFKNKRAALKACQDEYEAMASANPQFQCTFVSQATDCYRRQFRDCGEQGQWFGCEWERMGLQAAYGNCGQEFCKFGI